MIASYEHEGSADSFFFFFFNFRLSWSSGPRLKSMVTAQLAVWYFLHFRHISDHLNFRIILFVALQFCLDEWLKATVFQRLLNHFWTQNGTPKIRLFSLVNWCKVHFTESILGFYPPLKVNPNNLIIWFYSFCMNKCYQHSVDLSGMLSWWLVILLPTSKEMGFVLFPQGKMWWTKPVWQFVEFLRGYTAEVFFSFSNFFVCFADRPAFPVSCMVSTDFHSFTEPLQWF